MRESPRKKPKKESLVKEVGRVIALGAALSGGIIASAKVVDAYETAKEHSLQAKYEKNFKMRQDWVDDDLEQSENVLDLRSGANLHADKSPDTNRSSGFQKKD